MESQLRPSMVSDLFFSHTEKNVKNALNLAKIDYESYPDLHLHKAIHVENICLYSYTDILQETAPTNSLRSHFSPRLLAMRLRHAKYKNALYFNTNSTIYKPAIEISLSESCDAYKLAHALFPLTIEGFPLAWYWRTALRLWSRLMTLNRAIAGEKILCHFCSEDHMYFGSVYINTHRHFASIHCKNHAAIFLAIKRFQNLLHNADV